MLNKKLVLAALLGAALADDPPVEDPPATDPPATDPPATDPPATDPPATDPPAVEDDDDEEEDERLSRVWKEVMPDNSDMVLCDQGESALWEDAKAKLVDLASAKEATQTAFEEAEAEWTTANTNHVNASQDLVNFDADADVTMIMNTATPPEAEVHTGALTTANEIVATLLSESTAAVTPSVSDAQDDVDTVVNASTTAQGKVTDQLARVEGLLTAQRTQELEEATWEERRVASHALQDALDTALDDANAHVTMLGEQLDKRSYLFQMARDGIWPGSTNANYGSGCAFGYTKSQSQTNYDCTIIEAAGADKDTSVWGWQECWNDEAQGAGSSPTNTKCETLGLDDDADTDAPDTSDGLLTLQDSILGSSSTPTGLYLEFQNANPHYNASVTQTPHNLAITAYLAWQKKELLKQYLTIGLWIGQSGTLPDVQAGDLATGTSMNKYDNPSGTTWLPWINGGMDLEDATNAYYYAGVAAQAATAREAFDGWYATDSDWTGGPTSTPPALTPATFLTAAEKLTDVWHGEWVKLALQAEKDHIGATVSDGVRATAANDVNTATAAKEENEKNTAAMVRWKALATAEISAIQGDVGRARALLVALTAEVADTARLEANARAILATQTAAQEAKDLAITKLGVVGPPATGARAVQAAAQAARDSIAEQRKYHAGRVTFYAEVLDPLNTRYSDAESARDDALAAYNMGLSVLNGLRDQCKKQAFMFAQERLQKAQDAAAVKAEKITEVANAYATTSAFPAAPAVGALCNYPKGNADPAAKRPDCGEENCCGAAQRFLADGTKLSIETCQTPETTVYTYWPELPENALVAPTSETWRFQCISAAGRLATSVAAVLATGYMLA